MGSLPLGARGPGEAAWRGTKVKSTFTSSRTSTPQPRADDDCSRPRGATYERDNPAGYKPAGR